MVIGVPVDHARSLPLPVVVLADSVADVHVEPLALVREDSEVHDLYSGNWELGRNLFSHGPSLGVPELELVCRVHVDVGVHPRLERHLVDALPGQLLQEAMF